MKDGIIAYLRSLSHKSINVTIKIQDGYNFSALPVLPLDRYKIELMTGNKESHCKFN